MWHDRRTDLVGRVPARLVLQRINGVSCWLPAAGQCDPVAVHQERVATRRLREALPVVARGKKGRALLAPAAARGHVLAVCAYAEAASKKHQRARRSAPSCTSFVTLRPLNPLNPLNQRRLPSAAGSRASRHTGLICCVSASRLTRHAFAIAEAFAASERT